MSATSSLIELHRHCFATSLVGRAAADALAGMKRGRVLAVFQRSFYIETDRSELVCFGPASLGAGPLNALCEFPQATDVLEPAVINGAKVEKWGDVLRVERLAFSLATSTLWEPPSARSSVAYDVLGHALDELARATVERQVRGFGQLIPALVGRYEALPCKQDNVLLTRAWQGMKVFSRWLERALGKQEHVTSVPEQANILVGLGPGLTPAGDDFLGGVMLALRSLGEQALGDRTASWVLPLARIQTSKISFAHLRCAAAGEGAAAVHDMLSALDSHWAGALGQHIDAVDAIGHSSGWDTLAGIACAFASYLAACRPADKREEMPTCV